MTHPRSHRLGEITDATKLSKLRTDLSHPKYLSTTQQEPSTGHAERYVAATSHQTNETGRS